MKKVSPEDSALFRQTIGQVKPLRHSVSINLAQHSKPAVKPFSSLIANAALHKPLDLSREAVCAETTLFFQRSHLHYKLLRRLKQGNITPRAVCDLHGLTFDQAYIEIEKFMQRVQYCHYHCISIIHGKGTVLKNLVNRLLPQYPAVLAFCSAPRHQGGTGAVLVLLKNQT